MPETSAPKIFINIPVSRTSAWLAVLRTFVLQVTVIGIGVIAHSNAMQWCGFFALIVCLLILACNRPSHTPQQAADLLKEKFGVVAK